MMTFKPLLLIGLFVATAMLPRGLMGQHDPIVLHNLTVIDGNGGPPQQAMTIVISKGRITDLFPTGRKRAPSGARIMDLKGHYAIPGLIDSHVHVTNDPANTAAQHRLLRFALLGGVTSVRDMGGDAIILGELVLAAQKSEILSPRIFFSAMMAGPAWFSDPRAVAAAHGRKAGEVPWLRSITEDTDIEAAVSEAKAIGATGVKIYADLSPNLVARLSAEAHRQGLKVWSHATIHPSTPADAVAARVDVVSHAMLFLWQASSQVPQSYAEVRKAVPSTFPTFEEGRERILGLLSAMREKGTILDATVNVSSRMGAQRSVRANPWVTWSLGVTRLAKEMGIAIVAGSDDLGNPALDPVPTIHKEMELLVRHCGLTPLEAITAATLTGAKVLGVDQSHGMIKVGRVADLVVLREDPTVDIRNTTTIAYVIKDGKLYQPETK